MTNLAVEATAVDLVGCWRIHIQGQPILDTDRPWPGWAVHRLGRCTNGTTAWLLYQPGEVDVIVIWDPAPNDITAMLTAQAGFVVCARLAGKQILLRRHRNRAQP